jgi:hypothetical protein
MSTFLSFCSTSVNVCRHLSSCVTVGCNIHQHPSLFIIIRHSFVRHPWAIVWHSWTFVWCSSMVVAVRHGFVNIVVCHNYVRHPLAFVQDLVLCMWCHSTGPCHLPSSVKRRPCTNVCVVIHVHERLSTDTRPLNFMHGRSFANARLLTLGKRCSSIDVCAPMPIRCHSCQLMCHIHKIEWFVYIPIRYVVFKPYVGSIQNHIHVFKNEYERLHTLILIHTSTYSY